jgi:hypothetical protein
LREEAITARASRSASASARAVSACQYRTFRSIRSWENEIEAVTTTIVSHQPPKVPDRKDTITITTADGMMARLVGARAACRGGAVPM